jgi:tetratricopeptide (TPR) repeat protein
MSLRALVVVASVLVLAPAAGAAQDPEGTADAAGHQRPREAIELFQRAREEYQTGRYAEAASDLERALVLDPGSPTLLYNLARVYELSGDLPRAIQGYRSCVRVTTDENERARTELAIRRLEGAQEYRRPDEEEYSQALYVTQRGVADEAFWATLVAGGLVTLGGAGVAIAAAIADGAASGFVLGPDGNAAAYEAQRNTVATLALAADIVGAVGGATLLTAVLLWVLRERSVEMFPQHAPTVSVSPTGLTMHWEALF